MMEGSLIVATQLSSLYPPHQGPSIVLSTIQPDTPLPPPASSSDPPAEHAAFADFFYTPLTGTILCRLLHAGLIFELVSLAHDISPLRIVFPSPVLPFPAITLWEDQDLHIVALTQAGSLFRVVLPIRDGIPLWQAASTPGNFWFREHIVLRLRPIPSNVVVQVQSAHTVAVGLHDGSMLRLEAKEMVRESEHGQWEETVHTHASILASLTSFLHVHAAAGSEVISMTSLPQPTDVGDVWTLSRDRTLRMWTVTGCVSAKPLPAAFSLSTAHGSAVNAPKPSTLLQHHPRRLLRAFISPWSERPHVLAFIPTEPASLAAGFFHMFDTTADQLHLVGVAQSSENAVHAHLQDFIISDDMLYTLWDRGGQSVVEACVLHSLRDGKPVWQVALYPQQAELTPAYLDELLLSPGSLTDRYLEAVMRPGLFSPLTLQTALAQYIDTCLSLPGTTHSHPPQLFATYTSLPESIAAVVGCTVLLKRNPHTGSPQYDSYWSALKRDWEGFIARCREVERSARWPLAIGACNPTPGLLVAERERIGMVTAEDLALQLHRLLAVSQPLQPRYDFLEIIWAIRSRIGKRAVLSLESRLVDIVHQEIAFPYADIIQDQARRSDILEGLDEGLSSWIRGRLQTVGDMDGATRLVLDVIGGCNQSVKREEDDSASLLPQPALQWARALTASYISNSIEARYEFCVCLIALLFFLFESVPQWDPSLLAEIFVVFRGIAVLRHIARLPSDERKRLENTGEDEVIAKLSHMTVSSGHAHYQPLKSLLHQQLAGLASGMTLSDGAHHYLDSSGLLQSVSPAHATKAEVLFCESLRSSGHSEAAQDALAWLPRTPGVVYVQSRLWIDHGRYDDAATLLEGLSGSFGTQRGLSEEDADALASVLPRGELFDSEFTFYLHIATLFKDSHATSHEVHFTQSAVSVAPRVNTMSLWSMIIKGLIDLGLFEDAYRTLMTSPYERLKQECIPPLVYRMCEEHAGDQLISFNFHGHHEDVEECLAFKARNADPRARPFFSRILYAWYISRGDYRNASSTMHQRARKLNSFGSDPVEFFSLAELQLEAYATSINALSLADQKSAWFTIPAVDDLSSQHRPVSSRKKPTKFIPEVRYADEKRDVEVVTLADLKYEYTLLTVQTELTRLQPQLFFANEVISQPSLVVLKLAQLDIFDAALSAGQILGIDLSDVFALLTNRCLRLSRNPNIPGEEPVSDWLLTDKISSWAGTAADRAWRYLRQSLEQYDGELTGYAYSKTSFEAILAFERTSPPPWLVQILVDHHPEHLIRICLRYDVLDGALEYALNFVGRSTTLEPKGVSGMTSSATWLPYTLIDQVMVAAEGQAGLSLEGRNMRNQIRMEVTNRLRRMQKLSSKPH